MFGVGGLSDDGLRAPFPWYGGKRRVAKDVWLLLGDVSRYVEPFAGSLGVLLGRDGGVEEIWVGIEKWCREVDPSVAVVVCGYDDCFDAPDGWRTIYYTAKGTSSENKTRECMWVSPACHGQQGLF